jgi:hypothetical protein
MIWLTVSYPLFFRLNTCPFQGSRTIRTEEAVLISLAALCPTLIKSVRDKEKVVIEETPAVEFSDESPSDESSESSENDSDDE